VVDEKLKQHKEVIMKEEDKKEESSEDYVSEFSKVFKKIDAIKTLE